MNACFKRNLTVVAAACLLQAFAICALSHGQSATEAARPGQDAQPGVQLVAPDDAAAQKEWRAPIDEYVIFMELTYSYEQRAIRAGKDYDWASWARFNGFREDEGQTVHLALLDAAHQIMELKRQFYRAYPKLYYFKLSHRTPAYEEAARARLQQESQIENEMITRIKLALGREHFKRLDDEFYERWKRGHDEFCNDPNNIPKLTPQDGCPTRKTTTTENAKPSEVQP